MKNTAISITFKAATAVALCFILISQPQLWVSQASVAATHSAAGLKSESQFRSEAALYDSAIRAVSGIATMKLDKTEDLQRAIAILDRERPNLKLFFSKLVVIGLSDSSLANAVRKRAPSQVAAEAFAKEIEADRKAVLKLDGAESLTTRMRQSAESDAAVLRRAAERLKDASEKIKRISQQNLSPSFGRKDEFKMIRAGFSGATTPDPPPAPLMFIADLLIAALFVTAVLIVGTLYARLIIRTREEGEGQTLSDCIGAADNRLRTCIAAANIFTAAGCYIQSLVDKAVCLAN
ncbi:MAG: hypothetical protein ABI882_18995 [Acidobacteriota bacterium]